MRHLAQPAVLKAAAVAAAVTTLASYLRLSFWMHRALPIWYLEIMIFLCSMVLWGFVFAWHTPYTGRPLWNFKPDLRLFLAVTLLAIGAATLCHRFSDPLLRPRFPEEFPTDFKHWLAIVLFAMFLNRLFLLFAPFAWLMRLLKNQWAAAILTVLFGTFVLLLRIQSLPTPVPATFLVIEFTSRIIGGFLAVWFYLRGGILLIWWWTLLFQARQLWDLTGQA